LLQYLLTSYILTIVTTAPKLNDLFEEITTLLYFRTISYIYVCLKCYQKYFELNYIPIITTYAPQNFTVPPTSIYLHVTNEQIRISSKHH